jgi:hypothetical protein
MPVSSALVGTCWRGSCSRGVRASSGCRSAGEEGDDGTYPSVVVAVVGDAELEEDGAKVGFDGSFRDHEAAGDTGVGESLRDQSEHVAFSVGQPLE